MFSTRTSAETGNMTPRQFVQIPHPSHAVFKFPTAAKTVKFPTPRAQQRVKFPGYARGRGVLKLQFDRYIISSTTKCDLTSSVYSLNKNMKAVLVEILQKYKIYDPSCTVSLSLSTCVFQVLLTRASSIVMSCWPRAEF